MVLIKSIAAGTGRDSKATGIPPSKKLALAFEKNPNKAATEEGSCKSDGENSLPSMPSQSPDIQKIELRIK